MPCPPRKTSHVIARHNTHHAHTITAPPVPKVRPRRYTSRTLTPSAVFCRSLQGKRQEARPWPEGGGDTAPGNPTAQTAPARPTLTSPDARSCLHDPIDPSTYLCGVTRDTCRGTTWSCLGNWSGGLQQELPMHSSANTNTRQRENSSMPSRRRFASPDARNRHPPAPPRTLPRRGRLALEKLDNGLEY